MLEDTKKELDGKLSNIKAGDDPSTCLAEFHDLQHQASLTAEWSDTVYPMVDAIDRVSLAFKNSSDDAQSSRYLVRSVYASLHCQKETVVSNQVHANYEMVKGMRFFLHHIVDGTSYGQQCTLDAAAFMIVYAGYLGLLIDAAIRFYGPEATLTTYCRARLGESNMSATLEGIDFRKDQTRVKFHEHQMSLLEWVEVPVDKAISSPRDVLT